MKEPRTATEDTGPPDGLFASSAPPNRKNHGSQNGCRFWPSKSGPETVIPDSWASFFGDRIRGPKTELILRDLRKNNQKADNQQHIYRSGSHGGNARAPDLVPDFFLRSRRGPRSCPGRARVSGPRLCSRLGPRLLLVLPTWHPIAPRPGPYQLAPLKPPTWLPTTSCAPVLAPDFFLCTRFVLRRGPCNFAPLVLPTWPLIPSSALDLVPDLAPVSVWPRLAP